MWGNCCQFVSVSWYRISDRSMNSHYLSVNSIENCHESTRTKMIKTKYLFHIKNISDWFIISARCVYNIFWNSIATCNIIISNYSDLPSRKFIKPYSRSTSLVAHFENFQQKRSQSQVDTASNSSSLHVPSYLKLYKIPKFLFLFFHFVIKSYII